MTRGFGLLEVILAKKRARKADFLIDKKLRGGRILDIGCGCFPYFLNTTIFKEKYGIDNHDFVNDIKNDSVLLKKIDVEKQKIPYQDNFFDVVVMLAVFEHINPENLAFVLQEIYRVLKRNGKLILTTPSPWSAPILSLLSKFKIISDVEIADHKSSFGSEKITEYLLKVGFQREKINSGYFEVFLNMWIVGKK